MQLARKKDKISLRIKVYNKMVKLNLIHHHDFYRWIVDRLLKWKYLIWTHEKCTKSLQLITNCFNSQVTFVKFKNSEQCHVLLYDMRNLYKQYFGSIFHRHFQTTEIKASKQMPVEVAYKIDQNLGYGGVLLHEQTFRIKFAIFVNFSCS